VILAVRPENTISGLLSVNVRSGLLPENDNSGMLPENTISGFLPLNTAVISPSGGGSDGLKDATVKQTN
jgi:hypothetical protein